MKKNVMILFMAMMFAVMIPLWCSAAEPVVEKTYTQENVEEIKEYLPHIFYGMITNPELWGDDISIVVDPPQDLVKEGLNKWWYEATEEHKGKAKLGPRGELLNWVSGFPFGLEPKTGKELIWNIDLHYRGDDCWQKGEFPSVSKGYLEKNISLIVKYIYMKSNWGKGRRLFCKELDNPGGIQEYLYIGVYAPEEVSKTQTLEIRYYDPDKPDDVWSYIPSMRRVRRLSAAQRMDSFAGSDGTYDDYCGWHGKSIDWDIKLIGKEKRLILRNIPEDAKFNKKMYVLNPMRMQFKDVFVAEFIPKDPNHIYSKCIAHVDPETFEIPDREDYDRQGNLWKIHNGVFAYKPIEYACAGKTVLSYVESGAWHIDYKRGHGTSVHFFENKRSAGIPLNEMTVEAMRKFGR